MFEQTIETTIGHLGALVIGDAPGVTRREIARSSLPSGIRKMFDLDVERWVKEERERILVASHFRFDSDVASMIRDLSVHFRESAFFTREEFLAGLDRAVKLHFNYVCRPQWTMRRFIFADCENATVDSILSALDTFTEYEYYRIILREYFEKKDITVLHARKFEDLVASIDKELSRNLDTRKLAQLMQPVFEFFALGDRDDPTIDASERTIPIEAAILFYDDKDLATVVETLERSKELRGDITMHDLIMLLGEADIALSLDISTLISRHVDGHTAPAEVTASAAREYEIPEFGAFPTADSQEDLDEPALAAAFDDQSTTRAPVFAYDATDTPDQDFLADMSLDSSEAPLDMDPDSHDPAVSTPMEALASTLPDEFEAVLRDDRPGEEPENDLSFDDAETDTTLQSPYSIDGVSFQEEVLSSETEADERTEGYLDDPTGISRISTGSGQVQGDEISLDNIVLSDQTSVIPDHPDMHDPSSYAMGDLETTSLVMSLDDLIAGVPVEKETYKEDILAALELDSLDDDASPAQPGASSSTLDSVMQQDPGKQSVARVESVAEDVVAPGEIIARYGDLQALISAADRKRYVRKLFGRSESSYDQAIAALNGKATWREASEAIDELFLKHEVDLYSRVAVKFTDDVYKRYMTKKV